MTISELATSVGISEGVLQRVVDGDQSGLTFHQVRKIAGYFGRTVLFFFETGPVDLEQLHTVQYRTLANQKPTLSFEVKKLVERAERQRELFVSLRDEFDDEELPRFRLPAIKRTDVEGAADAIRQWLGISTDVKSFEAYRSRVEAKGILVFRSNGYAGKWQIPKTSPILGISLFDRICPLIVVKKTRWESQQTFTLMHELAHILLHHASSIDDESDFQSLKGMEREANRFAGLVLVPRDRLDQIRTRDLPDDVAKFDVFFKDFRNAWGVSTEVILRRLTDEGRLSNDTYSEFRSHLRNLPEVEETSGSRIWRHREPGHIFGSPFVKTVLNAVSRRRITAVKACDYLDGLKLTDLHQLERHVAGL